MILVDSNKKWDYALGLIKVDGLEPSAEFLELVEKEKEGKMTTDVYKRQEWYGVGRRKCQDF